DLLKNFRNCVDSICRLFWLGIGNVKLVSKYYVLAYVVHKHEGELFRVNLRAPRTFVAESMLKVNYSFNYSSFPNVTDIINLLFTVKSVFESNKEILYEYNVSCMETDKNITPVYKWLASNENTVIPN
ncbi:11565_t:CDS:2, partial [Funneliformis mosseae]